MYFAYNRVMDFLLLIHFAFVSTLSLIMFQFPTDFGPYKGPWMQSLRFIQPLTFFIFLNIPIVLSFYQYPLAREYYLIAYGLAFCYFLGGSLKDHKIGFNFMTAFMIISLIVVSSIIENYNIEFK